jgi:carbamoyl-phosphate synthase large subunit
MRSLRGHGKTYACFEPAIDYIVVKFPKWPFDKFVYGKRTLGTQMKATGEVMAIGTSFEQAMMKAIRSIELGLDTLDLKKFGDKTDGGIIELLHNCDDERIFVVFEALKRGVSLDEIFEITGIDRWFTGKLRNLADLQRWLAQGNLDAGNTPPRKNTGSLTKRSSGFPDAG